MISTPTKLFRDNGAIGALLDEYEKAVRELQHLISSLSTEDLVQIVDPETKDPDCVSIQSILTHVVHSGKCYVVAIRQWLGEGITNPPKNTLSSASSYITALDDMFAFNVKLFEDYPTLPLEEIATEKKIRFGSGQRYDVEQVIEHAIVHVLRHRRQIERFLIRLQSPI